MHQVGTRNVVDCLQGRQDVPVVVGEAHGEEESPNKLRGAAADAVATGETAVVTNPGFSPPQQDTFNAILTCYRYNKLMGI